MPIYAISDILGFAANAGFTGPDLATAAAIAMAESSGNSDNYNPETQARGGTPTGQGSYGLWQIYLKMHPQFDPNQLYDPQYNANAAYSIYAQAGGFSPWTTYGGQQYQTYLAEAQALVSAGGDGTTDGSTDGNGGDGTTDGSTTTDALVLGAALLLGLFLYLRG